MPVKTKRDEEKWQKAKEIAREQGNGDNWALIMGIYKKMKPDYEFKSGPEAKKSTTAGSVREEDSYWEHIHKQKTEKFWKMRPRKGGFVNLDDWFGDVWGEIEKAYPPTKDDFSGALIVFRGSERLKSEYTFPYQVRKYSPKLPPDARIAFTAEGTFGTRNNPPITDLPAKYRKSACLIADAKKFPEPGATVTDVSFDIGDDPLGVVKFEDGSETMSHVNVEDIASLMGVPGGVLSDAQKVLGDRNLRLEVHKFSAYLKNAAERVASRYLTASTPLTTRDIEKWLKKQRTWLDIDDMDRKSIHLSTRENGDVGEERPGRADYQEAMRLGKLVLAEFGSDQINVLIEIVDEWVNLDIALGGKGQTSPKVYF